MTRIYEQRRQRTTTNDNNKRRTTELCLSVNLELHKPIGAGEDEAPQPPSSRVRGLRCRRGCGEALPLPRKILDFGSQYDELVHSGWYFLQFSYMFVNWQLHISLTRTAQIYSELHYCVELHTKKSPEERWRRIRTTTTNYDDEIWWRRRMTTNDNDDEERRRTTTTMMNYDDDLRTTTTTNYLDGDE